MKMEIVLVQGKFKMFLNHRNNIAFLVSCALISSITGCDSLEISEPCLEYKNWPEQKFDYITWGGFTDRYKITKDLIANQHFENMAEVEKLLGKKEWGNTNMCYGIPAPPTKSAARSGCYGFQICYYPTDKGVRADLNPNS